MSRQETKEGGWKETIKSTQRNFERLQRYNAELDEANVTSDIDKLAINSHSTHANTTTPRSAVHRTNSFHDRLRQAKLTSSTAIGSSSTVPSVSRGEEDLNSMADIYGKEDVSSPAPRSQIARQTSRLTPTANPMNPSAAPPSPPLALGPEATDRYIKVKMQNMAKQLQDGADLKLKMEEQIKDLQKQLNTAREDNKTANKRIQQLELEIRKGNHAKRGSEAITANHDALVLEELAKAKKDLEAAERFAKNADTSVKSKDAQLKRAIESITRLKSQLQDAQQQLANGTSGDESRIETLEERVKLLEKQRSELYDGFRKQMKLIDVLKRQKLHLEAARLLSFTEEEFMKSLDWDA